MPQSSEEAKSEFLTEFTSHTLNYKSTVHQISPNKQFEISVYIWRNPNETLGAPHEGSIWERVSGPFLVDNFEQAQQLAQENLALMSGEIRDDKVPSEIITWLRAYSEDQNADFLDPKNYEIQDTQEQSSPKLPATKLVIVYDLYIAQFGEKWALGALEENIIQCWRSFSSLKEAIDFLKNTEISQKHTDLDSE